MGTAEFWLSGRDRCLQEQATCHGKLPIHRVNERLCHGDPRESRPDGAYRVAAATVWGDSAWQSLIWAITAAINLSLGRAAPSRPVQARNCTKREVVYDTRDCCWDGKTFGQVADGAIEN